MIPNPQKTIIVDFNIEGVKNAVGKLSKKTANKYTLYKKDDILNMYEFGALEVLSMGVYIDISLNAISDLQTKINIEVRRKVGAFDKSFEVSKANTHISTILSTISTALGEIKKNAEIIDMSFKSFTYTGFEFGWESFCRMLLEVVKKYSSSYKLLSKDEEKIVLHRFRNDSDETFSKYDTILTLAPIKQLDKGNCVEYVATKSNGKIETVGDLDNCLGVIHVTNKLLMQNFSEIKSKLQIAENELKELSGWQLGRKAETKKNDIEKKAVEIEKLKLLVS